MALIKNTGSYTVTIGVSNEKKKPGDSWKDKVVTPLKDVELVDPDSGSGSRDIKEGDCRYINAKHFKGKGDYYVYAIAADGHVLTSLVIKAHEFWVFDGENFYEREDLEQKDCGACHGS